MDSLKSDNTSHGEGRHWLDVAEISSVIAAGVGTVVGGLSQPAIFACLPISAALALNICNRNRLLNNMQSSNKAKIEQILFSHKQTEEKIDKEIGSQLEYNQLNDSNLTDLFQELKSAEQKTLQVEQKSTNLEAELKKLESEKNSLKEVVNELQTIENMSQAIEVNPDSGKFYYQRAQSRERLADKQGAIADYTQAIRFDSNLAEAFYHRGLLNIDLGQRRAALEDFRKAAKLFYEQGNLTSYQKAKELSRDFHELNGKNQQTSDSILITNLFS